MKNEWKERQVRAGEAAKKEGSGEKRPVRASARRIYAERTMDTHGSDLN
jgi:hypothetical protein